MSIEPGALKTKDPASIKHAQFDWDTSFLLVGVTIASQSITVLGPDSALVSSSVALASGNRKVNYILTGGTVGKRYRVVCQVTLSDSQKDERSFRVLIQDL